MTETVKKQWGGARQGAGGPRKTLSQKRIDDLMRLARKAKRETGKGPEDLLFDVMYARGDFKNVTLIQRNKAIETYLRHTMPTTSEQNVKVTKREAPAVYLPEQKPDPAAIVFKAEDADETTRPN